MKILFESIRMNHIHVVKNILEKYPETILNTHHNYDIFQYSVFWYKVGDFEMLELLLEFGADINSFYTDGHNEYTPLKRALLRSDKQLVLFLLQRGANPNQLFGENYKTTCMHYCAKYSKYIFLSMLIEYGGDINVEDGFGNNILHIITMFFTTIYNIEWLILKGLNPYHKNYDGKTPIDYVSNIVKLQVKEIIENAVVKINMIKIKLPQNVVDLLQSLF
jgi:ankyrin repeat protein